MGSETHAFALLMLPAQGVRRPVLQPPSEPPLGFGSIWGTLNNASAGVPTPETGPEHRDVQGLPVVFLYS